MRVLDGRLGAPSKGKFVMPLARAVPLPGPAPGDVELRFLLFAETTDALASAELMLVVVPQSSSAVPCEADEERRPVLEDPSSGQSWGGSGSARNSTEPERQKPRIGFTPSAKAV